MSTPSKSVNIDSPIDVNQRRNNNLPKISVIMIHSRDKWLKSAIESVERQIYPNMELIQIENMDKKRTIGKCWNIGVEKAEGDYCFFMGDDDQITPDYLMCLMTFIKTVPKKSKMRGVTSYLTAFDEEQKKQVPVKIYPTGMFEKKYLEENPFNEKTKKRVDTKYYKDHAENVAGICYWHYGYFYRQHDNMLSGRSVRFTDKKNAEIKNGKFSTKPKLNKRIIK